MSMCRVFYCVVGRGCLLRPVCSPGKTVSLWPASFCNPSKFACSSRYLLTSYFCIPVCYNEKDIFFGSLSILQNMHGLDFSLINSKSGLSCFVQLLSCFQLCNSMDLSMQGFPFPSISPWICPSSWPLHWWCHPTTSSSVSLFFCLQSFPASSCFPMSWLFTSCGQSIGGSAAVRPMSIQGWFPLRLTGLISLLSNKLSRVFSSTTVWRHQFFSTQPSLWSNSHNCTWLLERPQPWLYGPLSAKWCLCFLTQCLGLSQFSWYEAIIF